MTIKSAEYEEMYVRVVLDDGVYHIGLYRDGKTERESETIDKTKAMATFRRYRKECEA